MLGVPDGVAAGLLWALGVEACALLLKTDRTRFPQNTTSTEADRVAALSQARGGPIVGATGSRLLSGTTWYHREVEAWMAGFFRRCANE